MFENFVIALNVLYALLILFAEISLRITFQATSAFVPKGLLHWFQGLFARLFRGFKFKKTQEAPELKYDTSELIKSRGYPFEEYYVETTDGFVLGLHRIPGPKAFVDEKHQGGFDRGSGSGVDGGSSPIAAIPSARPVVFLLHGLCQCSEVWVVHPDSLAFVLAEAGFDVWLGNVRGNKYSSKHVRLTPRSDQFWNFCMDDIARYDMPASLWFVLSHTGARTLSYIAFSQGCAVGFGSFALNPALASRINVFCALAPATTAKGFSNQLLNSLAKISPAFVYLLLGRQRVLPSANFWKEMLSTKLYTMIIDGCLKIMFGWDMANVRDSDKPLFYAHIYSYSSTKLVVHWFQILQSQHFQMYQDWGHFNQHNSLGRRTPRYPIHQIQTPLAIFMGGRDQLPDNTWLLHHLPSTAIVHQEETYEHLDFVYAATVKERIYTKVVRLCLEHQASAEKSYHMSASSAIPIGGFTPLRLGVTPQSR